MAYRLHIVNAAGTHAALEAPFGTIEQAMTIACAALRHGARDAWVEDDNGRKVADFAAIQKHCASAPADSSPTRCSSPAAGTALALSTQTVKAMAYHQW
jgi:hypothetical protein